MTTKGGGTLVSLLGATGVVGEEILRCLAERKFPVLELRAFASADSEGREVDFDGDVVAVESVQPDRVFGTDGRPADVVISAAPGALESLLDDPRAQRTAIVDLTGTLELDDSVPLFVPGERLPTGPSRAVAVPRGAVGALGTALRALEGASFSRLSVVTVESASGAGRRGVSELSEQTVSLLNSMTGDPGESDVFPEPLAFNAVPVVGELLATGETSEERRLRHVIRRLLAAPALPVEITRLRAPVFGGSLVCVHAGLDVGISAPDACSSWSRSGVIYVLDADVLPSTRGGVGADRVQVGRVRAGEGHEAPSLSFVLAVDELRAGAALGAVEAAERLIGLGA